MLRNGSLVGEEQINSGRRGYERIFKREGLCCTYQSLRTRASSESNTRDIERTGSAADALQIPKDIAFLCLSDGRPSYALTSVALHSAG